MAIGLIIMATMAAISVAKGGSDKKKARDKYYLEAQEQLIKQSKSVVSQTEEQRQEALKSIAKQYAVNVINQNLAVQKQAQEMADKKVKRDKIIAITTGAVAITILIAHLIKQN
jgi:hypothetical protein